MNCEGKIKTDKECLQKSLFSEVFLKELHKWKFSPKKNEVLRPKRQGCNTRTGEEISARCQASGAISQTTASGWKL